MNHRHEDFQSTALPLSYPGTGEFGKLGEGLLWCADQSVQRDLPIFVAFSLGINSFQIGQATVLARPVGFPNLNPCTNGFL